MYRILIVDDEDDIRFLVRHMLDKQYEVVEAVNGLDALEKIERYEPDFVVMDVQMPLMTGFEACACIRDNPRFAGLGVLFLTSMSSRDNVMKGYELGANVYLTKPVNQARLLKNLQVHLESTPPQPKPKRYSIEEIHQAEKEGLVPVAPGAVEYAPVGQAPKDAVQTALRVMVIEDGGEITSAVRDMVKANAEVVGMNYGRHAISLLVKAQPDLLVLELTEPHQMGLHLCRALRANRSFDRVAILVCAENPTPRKINTADQAGADSFLPKPFTAADFMGKIEGLRKSPTFQIIPKLVPMSVLEELKESLKQGETAEENPGSE